MRWYGQVGIHRAQEPFRHFHPEGVGAFEALLSLKPGKTLFQPSKCFAWKLVWTQGARQNKSPEGNQD